MRDGWFYARTDPRSFLQGQRPRIQHASQNPSSPHHESYALLIKLNECGWIPKIKIISLHDEYYDHASDKKKVTGILPVHYHRNYLQHDADPSYYY